MGIMIEINWQKKIQYENQWKNNFAQGEGKLLYADRDEYEREEQRGQTDDFGIYLQINWACYEDQWKNDYRIRYRNME
ncbi:unnamed protein product [Paramecium sonneborni]|uniref:Uncharacterized protein n=1 Tax=Paramecium sonneborni TaxID=65129 RepID=A0A8S1RJZ3_9CILI|nr:unnamed protein product [Paramecium sonneborni]